MADIEGWHEVCASCSDAARGGDAGRGAQMIHKSAHRPIPARLSG